MSATGPSAFSCLLPRIIGVVSSPRPQPSWPSSCTTRQPRAGKLFRAASDSFIHNHFPRKFVSFHALSLTRRYLWQTSPSLLPISFLVLNSCIYPHFTYQHSSILAVSEPPHNSDIYLSRTHLQHPLGVKHRHYWFHALSSILSYFSNIPSVILLTFIFQPLSLPTFLPQTVVSGQLLLIQTPLRSKPRVLHFTTAFSDPITLHPLFAL